MPLPAMQSETLRALPSAWIDRLFERFSVMYGKHWFDLWADVPQEAVKAAWSEDLAFASGDQIRKALDHCKAHCKFPPTSPEFVGLCKSFAESMDTRRQLEDKRRHGDVDPKVRTAIAEFLNPERKCGPKDWARQILALNAQGKYPSFCGVAMAKRALGL